MIEPSDNEVAEEVTEEAEDIDVVAEDLEKGSEQGAKEPEKYSFCACTGLRTGAHGRHVQILVSVEG
ncbi:hypothetical protein PEX1_077480 [Penicillium expansum]|uniref:Uncharacterized protein n=1 Tax=Penicillium expansum TaxID=27334 RepID=A0A0A2KIW2_PENEN|nr:hypothetical protein PEX2_099770 [Penicillium expansum]KGO43938.1 hypothetical protein PEXP_092090 [Penicillium expansum]KGO60961.1 hypothetical protein PEX2_099770 [Penicillium expansum]KGO66856.1 hypothetical protein PEX1_077480 [Penicillium expansum]